MDKSAGDAGEPDFFCACAELKPTDPCSSPVDPGTCDGAERRFAYNPVTKRCQAFSYSGCGGNENNFALRKHCAVKCNKGRNGTTAPSASDRARVHFADFFVEESERVCVSPLRSPSQEEAHPNKEEKH